ncbi:MAG: hypothetical protein IKS31_10940 [Clostridia bacterium]|nr:hypothetical protein [Clostridia bacterium]
MLTPQDLESSLSFTLRAWDRIDDTVETEDFATMDTEAIYGALSGKMREIPFRDYLKRYLYRRTEMLTPFSRVETEEYQEIVTGSFQDSETPCSFSARTTRLSQAVHNWLTRDDVSRDSVLLMGFGLYMTEEDVNAFLTRGLRDMALDPDDPREAVCAYCYRHGYRFAKFRQLWKLYEAMDGGVDTALIGENHPLNRAASRVTMEEDTELLSRLLRRKGSGEMTPARRRVAETFSRLYDEAQALMCSETAGARPTPRSLERVLSAGIPVSSSGNLVPEALVRARKDFAHRRVSRQRLHRILAGTQPPGRYDLLSLHFYLQSRRLLDCADRKEALQRYIASANEILTGCGFGGIYPADPFDALLILCMLSCDPLGTYSDVMEKVYAADQAEETGETT